MTAVSTAMAYEETDPYSKSLYERAVTIDARASIAKAGDRKKDRLTQIYRSTCKVNITATLNI